MLAGDAILTFPRLIGFTHIWQAQTAALDLLFEPGRFLRLAFGLGGP